MIKVNKKTIDKIEIKDFISHIESLPVAPTGMSAYDHLKSLELNKDKFLKIMGNKEYDDH